MDSMTNRWRQVLAWAAMLFASPALAQNQCRIPDSVPPARAVLPPPGAGVLAPKTGHVLALSWSPQYCKENGDDKRAASQCRDQKFGFILHGLWADGAGRNNPVWCKKVGTVPDAVLKKNFCATPSFGLMRHEWAKHGSCIEADPERYFRAGSSLFSALKFPDMMGLSRSPISVGEFRAALAAANPGMTADMFTVQLTPLNWLEDVRVCLGTTYHPRPCPSDISGSGDDSKMKIWRSGG
jgi:ribonuclease T2